jgi:hypothetical protein
MYVFNISRFGEASYDVPLIDIRVQQVDRTLRLRENKRRNRQRQKDYTAELESRLRNLQSEGVKATQEVQLSARRVVQDNLRLKALLRSKGVDEHTINTWTPDGEIANSPTAKGQGASTTVCLVRNLYYRHFNTEPFRKQTTIY